MFFPSEEEKRNLIKGILPKARVLDVSEDLRGWNWYRPPLEPPFDIRLPLYEVANHFCRTGRDVFLKEVMTISAQPTEEMVQGRILHKIISHFVLEAKKLLYAVPIKGILQSIESLRSVNIRDLAGNDELQLLKNPEELITRMQIVWNFELQGLEYRITQALSKQKYISNDALIAITLPVVVDQKLDGSFLGLSRNLSADASTFFETIIYDIKFGKPMDFYRLATTGYAMVLEAIYEFPVTCGCIVYADFYENRLLIERDYHLIGDELRQWFIESRDEKSKIVFEEYDPGKPDECYSPCPYNATCNANT
ncbi:MAG: type I-A CRISPR-associated protein Cas4/Csa1 [Actinobacteria bacterium]|nr:type I-A CRISPR-associated protein Cas4/Csa1 [Actinomycetota bacterium]